jgi:murein DD-endopeptidase MepM/ murein hydrolase activator NlpD
MLSVIARLTALLLAAFLLAAVPVGPAAQAGEADPRWVFYTKDKTRYHSPWYAKAHRIMIPFGCTRAPYYSPDPRCKKDRGFHHGLDIAMPCGTRLVSDRWGWVVSNDALGSAYGVNPIRLRNFDQEWDVVIGHTRKVLVEPGDRIRPGTRLGRASDSGAPDGCHLHFEKRALKGGLSSAVKPRRMLQLKPKSKD